MAMEFNVEIIHKETIKPSSPTPLSLKNLKLSLFDQLTPPNYLPLLYFYPNYDPHHDIDEFAKARSLQLKKSLAETLTRFYPFAGRIVSNSLIECNDEGVEYIETRVNCHLHDILKQRPHCYSRNKLLPPLYDSITEALTDDHCILMVKVNFFECGGMAIGVSISHKVADLFTLSTFINTWAAMAQGNGNSNVIDPEFGTFSSLFPPMPLPNSKFQVPKVENVATRRLVFDASKISMLKAQAASRDVAQPSRVQAVTGLIWKCAMAAATSNRGGLKKPSVLHQVVNLRRKMNPPLPEYSMGNFVHGCISKTGPEYCETELMQGLVKQLSDGIREFNENKVRKIQGRDGVSAILESLKEMGSYYSKKEEFDLYISSSVCRFNLYVADFGWGKPIWVSVSDVTPTNSFILMDSRDEEAIEAWLTLNVAEMAFFERNEELLAFASVNPAAVIP
ncbi:Transferase [Corchorus olitorius]|uniref:Transferase n=1 Tax=Corchorus olitorius TaxID=93759 RepID=A0A1R3IFY1_9ROSI|nr:Transferase [Corchorus olitorius]